MSEKKKAVTTANIQRGARIGFFKPKNGATAGKTIRRRERIDSRIVVEDLRKKIGKNQIIYDFREPCSCRPAQLEVSE